MATLASDGSSTDVQAKINAANPGDIVTLPSGTFTWTTGISCAKGITIQGNTTITGTHADGSTTPATQASPVINDLTTIVDQVTNRSAAGVIMALGGQPATDTLRVTGITFTKGTSSSGTNGAIRVEGTLSKLNRIDHCHIYHVSNSFPLYIGTTQGGVVDHSVIEAGSPVGVFGQTVHCENGGGGPAGGDAPWADIAHFGTDIGFWFIEDCYLYFTQPDLGSGGGIDCYRGGKYAVRYTTLRNMQAQSHGTDSGGRLRGVRCTEVYNNVWLWDNGFAAHTGEFRGGSGLLHHNTFLNDNANTVWVGAGSYRMWVGFSPWGGAFGDPSRGNSPYDLNDVADHSGNGFGGGPNGLFASGTHTGVSGLQLTLIDNNHTWTAGQWVGYSVVKTSGTYNGGYVISNDAHQINIAPNAYSGSSGYLNFNNGDTYEIHKVIQVIDQAGGGKGDLLTGNPPLPAQWPHQAIEPIYSWNNKDRNGTYVGVFAAQPNVVEGVSMFNNTSMPTYTPFTYPHPLVSLAPGKIISLSGNGLDFGNVTIGTTPSPTGTLVVSNIGDTLLTVSAISYPAAFSGPTTGFTVDPGSFVNKTVTFTPGNAQLYTGNIIVTSDATSGTNTIAVSGTGVNPVPITPHGHKRRPTNTFMT